MSQDLELTFHRRVCQLKTKFLLFIRAKFYVLHEEIAFASGLVSMLQPFKDFRSLFVKLNAVMTGESEEAVIECSERHPLGQLERDERGGGESAEVVRKSGGQGD